jgi:hypothetical protein
MRAHRVDGDHLCPLACGSSLAGVHIIEATGLDGREMEDSQWGGPLSASVNSTYAPKPNSPARSGPPHPPRTPALRSPQALGHTARKWGWDSETSTPPFTPRPRGGRLHRRIQPASPRSGPHLLTGESPGSARRPPTQSEVRASPSFLFLSPTRHPTIQLLRIANL